MIRKAITCTALTCTIVFAAAFGAFLSHGQAAPSAESRRVELGSHRELVTCDGVDEEIRFEIIFDLIRSGGSSRIVAQAMRASDPNLSEQAAEIAMFMASEGTLDNRDTVVIGYVDLNNPHTGRRGERIGSTVLGQLRSVVVDIDMNIEQQVSPLKKHSGEVTYLKNNGEKLVQDLDCVRKL